MDKKRLIEQLKIDEGYSLKVYLDTKGYLSCGIGHLILPKDNLKLGDTITDQRVLELFDQDLQIAIKECKKLPVKFDTLPDEIQEVLINMSFNMGISRLLKFVGLLGAIRNSDWNLAAIEIMDSKAARELPNRYNRLKNIILKLL